MTSPIKIVLELDAAEVPALEHFGNRLWGSNPWNAADVADHVLLAALAHSGAVVAVLNQALRYSPAENISVRKFFAAKIHSHPTYNVSRPTTVG